MENLHKKIETLGGISDLDEKKMLTKQIKDWLSAEDLEDINIFIKFVSIFGGKVFNRDIVCPNVKYIPISDSKGQIPVSIILGFTTGELGIDNIRSLVSTNIKKGYIPFAIGDPTGDYWVYNKLNGGVYFWLHDAEYINDALYKVANGIEEFILILDERKAENSENKIIDFWLSDKF